MKKKGLLISTIVMVVVLVASLTTATYAWFSATATVKIDTMSLKTTATKGLVIGVKDPARDHGYGNGTCEWDGTKWISQEDGLGSNIYLTISDSYSGAIEADNNNYGMTVTKACTPYDGSGAWLLQQVGKDNPSLAGSGNYAFVKAESTNGTDDPDMRSGSDGTIDVATKNIDYIDLELGVSASAVNAVDQAYCTIEINAPQADLRMAAALHMSIIVEGETGTVENGFVFEDKDIFSSDSSIALGNNNNFGAADGINKLRFAFNIFSKNADCMGADQFAPAVKVRIIAWFEGYDQACNNNNTGLGDATMTIHFDYVKNGDTPVAITNYAYSGMIDANWN